MAIFPSFTESMVLDASRHVCLFSKNSPKRSSLPGSLVSL